MDWSLAQLYYLVASVSGITATAVSLIVFFRSQPDRLKQKMSEALEPFDKRLQSVESCYADMERAQEEAAQRHDLSVRALDHEVNARLREFGGKAEKQHHKTNAALAAQSQALARIAAQLEHGVNRRDIDTLHHRITDVSKTCAATSGVVDGLAKMVHNIEDYLRSNGRG